MAGGEASLANKVGLGLSGDVSMMRQLKTNFSSSSFLSVVKRTADPAEVKNP